MNTVFNGYENLSAAVSGMAVGTGDLGERLRNAYVFNIVHVDRDCVPESCRQLLKDIHEAFNRTTSSGTRRDSADSVRSMPAAKQAELASKIVKLADSVAAAYHAERLGGE